MTQHYLIGNWKCNKDLPQALNWLDRFFEVYEPVDTVEVILAPPFLVLAEVAAQLRSYGSNRISLAAQDLSPFPSGSYTGAVAADMLKGVADYAIVGHPERRQYFHETSQDVTNKVSEAADGSIKPIICVDPSYAMSQLTSIMDIDIQQLIISYNPVDVRSYRAPESEERVAEAIGFISEIYPRQPIVYGGSITERNASRYAQIKGVSGLVVGAASLDPDTFSKIHAAIAASVR